MTDDDVVQAENRYRQSLGWALSRARDRAAEVPEAFEKVRLAMDGGAWDSTTARQFSQTRREKTDSATTAANDCIAMLQARHGNEPRRVDRSDRRARWV